MHKTWYSGGVPEYQAGNEYDLDRSVAERLIRRGVAVIVHVARPEAEAVIPLEAGHIPVVPASKTTRKKRATK